MAQTIKQREYLFRARPRRTRPALAVALLGLASLVAAGQTGDAAEPSGPADRSVVYGAVGGPERFVLETRGEAASIRFLCLASEMQARGAVCDRPTTPLRARTDGAARVLTDEAGRPVVTFAARGVRLHPGSDAVPATVPPKGRTVLPTDAKA